MPNINPYDEYNRLGSPEYATGEINRKMQLANPILQSRLAAIKAQLAKMGMLSGSPTTTATYKATGDLTNEVTGGVYSDISSQRMELLRMIMAMQEEEKRRKEQRSAGMWGGLGNLLGTAAGYMLPGMGSIGKLLGMDGGSYGNIEAPRFNYTPYRP